MRVCLCICVCECFFFFVSLVVWCFFLLFYLVCGGGGIFLSVCFAGGVVLLCCFPFILFCFLHLPMLGIVEFSPYIFK